MGRKLLITYVTSSDFKIEEARILIAKGTASDGSPLSDLFDFDFQTVSIPEMLEVDIEKLVRAEVVAAYGKIRKPCIVEHAGLVFDGFKSESYPGGLTKPMWNTLKDSFVAGTGSADKRAAARAVVAYCDGMKVRTFVGETSGRIAKSPSGDRKFYWDTVFVPDDPSSKAAGKTYAQISGDHTLGVEYKVLKLSQSAKAMMMLFDYLRSEPRSPLWKS